ncbi:nitrogen fixation protein FixH [Piscinibacter sp. Jin2]|uniref:Nitrogen fixation protein FixH n=1 Tax=Aquariibacter lacus TaxID=2801332 RepID=A0A9X0XE97_9BURK|nr:nitrogen fixation protein FixH [Piscinibacter lacus]MBL0720284.1 nitrogen fixation protein FixH [Piscinibacter lacus]
MSRPNPAPSASTPWWREGFMWLVLGGPAVVVVAGVATVVIATRGADTLLPTRPVQLERSAAPAMQGRNHAVTPLPAPAAAR